MINSKVYYVNYYGKETSGGKAMVLSGNQPSVQKQIPAD